MTETQAADAPAVGSSRRLLLIYLALGLAGLAPTIALGIYGYFEGAKAVTGLVRSNNLAAAEITAGLVKQEFRHRINVLRDVATAPDFAAAVAAHDVEAVRSHLQRLVESFPNVVRAFVSDPAGILWSDFPIAPESLGKSFTHRDWYQGVTKNWQPYVSVVHRRNALPQLLLVAVATGVHDPADGSIVGIVAIQVRLEGITQLLKSVQVGSNGFVFLLDHAGTVAAHPVLDLQEHEHTEYRDAEPVLAARAGASAGVQYRDPVLNEPMLAAAVPCDVDGEQWMVVAQQPTALAFRPVRSLAAQFAVAGGLVVCAIGGLFVVAARNHHRVRRLHARTGELNRRLEVENQQRRRAEQDLQTVNEELERRVQQRTAELRDKDVQLQQAQRMESIGRLAGGVAHDFNNLLTIINGYCEMAIDTASADSPLRGQLEEIRKAGERATALTRQLLAFSRKQVLQPQVLSLNTVVEGMGKMLERLIGEDIDLELRLAPNLDAVRVDPGQIEQIIMNLAINARDAMPDGGRLTIETAAVNLDDNYVRTHLDAHPGLQVMLAVTDTGIGMDASTRSRIFEPFFTTKELGHGTGLGLSTVYGIVRQSGGTIWVYSEPGLGTTFKIYLPRAEEGATDPRQRSTAPAVALGSATVLLVEDDAGVRNLVRTVLMSGGYTVLAAADGEEALALWRERAREVDLLLSDVVLPGMGGRKLAEVLLADKPDLRVVYMSGYTDNAIVHHGVLDPGTAFIEKPIAPDALLRRIGEYLTRTAAEAADSAADRKR